MNARRIAAGIAGLVLTAAVQAQTPLGTGFSYQGHLNNNGSPANGTFNMVFRLFDALTGGSQIGPTLTFNGAGGNPPPVSVVNGLFAVQLDFGAVFQGDRRFLAVTVSGVPLSPRQELTATPYALFSAAPWVTSTNGLIYNGARVGIGTQFPSNSLDVVAPPGATPNDAVIRGINETTAQFDDTPGVLGQNTGVSGTGVGVLGLGNFYGVEGESVFEGVHGVTTATQFGAGVTGEATGNGNNNIGVAGSADGTACIGVKGLSFGPMSWAGYFDGRGYFSDNVGIGVTEPPVRLSIEGGTDVQLSGGGYLQLGAITSSNIAIDDNEIMARSNGAVSGLFLNHEGGNVIIADLGAGNLGLGTSNPAQRLHVIGNICATGTIGACSDARFKKNVEELKGSLDAVRHLRGVSFTWDRENFADHQFAEGRQIGFIAQEVNAVVPGVVQTGSDGYLAVDYGRLTPVIVEAVKEQQKEVDSLRRENAELRARLERLESRIADR